LLNSSPQISHCHNNCPDLEHIDCSSESHRESFNQDIKESFENSINNISNLNTPGYRRISSYKDPVTGEYIVDNSQGRLSQTGSPLDIAVKGSGKGIMLADGEYTRDGRLKFGEGGRLVRAADDKPLAIDFEKGAPTDWSALPLQIDRQGNVYNRSNRQRLGQIKADIAAEGYLIQGYAEGSNINMPLELMDFTRKLRLLESKNASQSSQYRLDSEAIQVARGAV